MIKRALALVAIAATLALLGLARARALRPALAAGRGSVAERAGRVLEDPAFKGARVGVHLRNLATGEALFDRDGDALFPLASNMKLVTTACALARLGPDAALETELLRLGPVEDGELRGDLLLRSNGDPNLSPRLEGAADAVFRSWARALSAMGVERVTGRILVDARAFTGPAVHPEWPRNQLHRWYCAEVSAVSFNDNCVAVIVEPGAAEGARAKVRLVPETGYVDLAVEAVTCSERAKHNVIVDRAPAGNRVTVSGHVWKGAERLETEVAVHRPDLYAATVLHETLAREGVAVQGFPAAVPADWAPPPSARLVARHSAPLGAVVAIANKRSQNLYAEILFRSLGRAAASDGSFEGGRKAVGEALEKLAGIPKGACEVADGSGLARGNRLTPRQVVDLLAAVARAPFAEDFRASLSVAGLDGTLKGRFPAARGRVHAKTGTIAGVSTLSGYAEGPRGEPYAFAILFEGVRGVERAREAQDELVSLLLGEPAEGADGR